MNEQRELSPTQESPEPQPDRTTVHIQQPTVAGADGTEALWGCQPDTEALTGDGAAPRRFGPANPKPRRRQTARPAAMRRRTM